MRTGTCFVEVFRGAVVESRHRVHVAVAHAERGLVARTGDAGHVSFVRSAIKMFQVLPFVEAGGVDRLGFTDEELALCTASHGGEVFHVATAQSMLSKAGAREEDLACGPQAPRHKPSANALRAAGVTPSRIHNNCSGKHAGMLALASQQGWPLGEYHQLQHPVQQRVVQTLARWADLAEGDLRSGIDGCGLPTFALPLAAVAAACARFSAAAADQVPGPRRIVAAMTDHPQYVAGTDRLCTDLMRVARGRLFAKVGAEGFYCAGVPSARTGVAIKVEDGAWRAVEPALLAALRAIDAIGDAELQALSAYAEPPILNTRGETVGSIRATLSLHTGR